MIITYGVVGPRGGASQYKTLLSTPPPPPLLLLPGVVQVVLVCKPDNYFLRSSNIHESSTFTCLLAAPVQGTTFQVTCQAEGYPRPVVTWTRAAMPLPSEKTKINQGTLTINNLSPADNDLYDCVATNIIGTKKARINVAVQRTSAAGLS